MKVLFIARTYPPVVGGMQKFASDFYNNYKKVGDIDLLANTGGKKMTPFFFVKVAFFLIFHSRDYDVIHIYDAVLSPLVLIIKTFSKAKVSFTVNGLDIVFAVLGYQTIMPFFLKKADRIFAISQYTFELCEIRGIPKEKMDVIPVGVDFDHLLVSSESEKSETLSKYNIPRNNTKILLTVGRLVKRKGHSWFITEVLNKLPEHYIYLIVGVGPEQAAITETIQNLNLTNRVFLLGNVSDEEKNCLYQISDLFVMPNISVKNDSEGFGIVLLEAGGFGLPVIASNIEGIKDAVIHQKTGFLLEEKNVQAFIDTILHPDHIDRSTIRTSAISHFDWKYIIERYQKEFERMLENRIN